MSLAVIPTASGQISNAADNWPNPNQAAELLGHSGDVFTCDFSVNGDHAASAGFDRTIMLWNTQNGIENYSGLRGHTNAILQVRWSQADGTKLFTASADKSVAWWDVVEGERVKNMKGHSSIVNCCSLSRSTSTLGFSGGDDGTVRVWDMRTRRCEGTFEHLYQILSLDNSESGDRIFAGTIDNSILVLDARRLDEPLAKLYAPGIDSVTGVAVSHDGDSLLSLSMNGNAHLWDIRPFCESGDRCMYTYSRIANNQDWKLLRVRWSPDDLCFSVGSCDPTVSIHKVRPSLDDMDSLLCSMPGHTGSVNEIVFHPKERYSVLSASSDRKLIYGPVVSE
jgi:Prp8 binding protein